MIAMRKDRKTLEEIAQKYKLSRERIRQIIVKAESKLAKGYPVDATT
jgi:DNA-directed RNA polymerase sigma subunit (sigma70/sigma32)